MNRLSGLLALSALVAVLCCSAYITQNLRRNPVTATSQKMALYSYAEAVMQEVNNETPPIASRESLPPREDRNTREVAAADPASEKFKPVLEYMKRELARSRDAGDALSLLGVMLIYERDAGGIYWELSSEIPQSGKTLAEGEFRLRHGNRVYSFFAEECPEYVSLNEIVANRSASVVLPIENVGGAQATLLERARAERVQTVATEEVEDLVRIVLARCDHVLASLETSSLAK
jgi:hypothetical protein